MTIHSYKSRVIIIDPDDHVRRSLELLINSSEDFIVVHAADSIDDPSRYVDMKPDVVLVDLPYSRSESIDFLREIRSVSCHIQVILYCLHEDNELLLDAIKSGACGYVSKSSNYAELRSFLQLVIDGEATMTSKLASMIIADKELQHGSAFSNVQQQMLNFLSRGKTYIQIGEELSISKSQLRREVKRIYQHINQLHQSGVAAAKRI
ncbi:MAG TPA: response regulator transcription factor [Chryseosolibacter sp.]|nr:response regulator transcription factor [Chryseosolibacter sp.]